MHPPERQVAHPLAKLSLWLGLLVGLIGVATGYSQRTQPAGAPVSGKPSQASSVAQFHQKVEPILKDACYDCHGNGESRANIAFDTLTNASQILNNPELWLKVLKNTRAGLMPPPKKHPRLPPDQQAVLDQWIEFAAFGVDPQNLDPGRVTVRRLNRTEYRNSLRDLLGIDFPVETALPPDDVGYGFDNIGDVLSISPMRMEKFIEAAMAAVEMGVPMDTVVIPSQFNMPKEYVTTNGQTAEHLSFYQARTVSHRYQAKVAGDYRLIISSKVDGEAVHDPQLVRVTGTSDGKEFFRVDHHWSDAEYFTDERVIHWEPGEHEVSFSTEPLLDLQPLPTKMEFQLLYLRLEGPLDRKDWEHPPGYQRFYTRDVPPTNPAERRAYAREVLGKFVPKAFRRPVSDDELNRLVALAEKNYSLPGVPFEKGIAQAMVAALASPQFLFHMEKAEPLARGQAYAKIDEYTLAARLSFALWSSIPDDELTQAAARGELRKNFQAQVKRMLADPKAQAFGENFPGQWLQSRGVLDIPINSLEVMAREASPAPAASSTNATAATPVVQPAPAVVAAATPAAAPTPVLAVGGNTPAATPAALAPSAGNNAVPFRAGRGGGRIRGAAVVSNGTSLTPEIRAAMKQEVEACFNHIVREDRSVLELLQSDYTFVNDALAPVYGITNITGPEMREVKLPPDNPRGGVLTMGAILTVTSNPTRTSPVKRGKWILQNILGQPPAPPPPNIPALEDTQAKITGHQPTQRELLAIHRENPLCASCHSRMDPLGFAMENFNAFGRARSKEYGQPIDPSGELATGEKFADARDLKSSLVEKHRIEFYRTITEKLLTYVLGRGVEYYDMPTVDGIAARLDKEDGRFSALLMGVLESAPFQERRATPHAVALETTTASTTPKTSLK
jgi:Protein of unknown function (DUF1588)/Protein of unknown function (DUF1587)/Protein of unknown function (DUF1592)/Protein of unknown function (DUF1585)/Protein of unknown function (DUF1595)/Planctomycete cytochrome C